MDFVVCKEVIISNIKRVGKGVVGDPIRGVTEVYDKDGTLIADMDRWRLGPDKIIDFIKYLEKQEGGCGASQNQIRYALDCFINGIEVQKITLTNKPTHDNRNPN